MEEQEHTKNLLNQNQRNLQRLQEQAAGYGPLDVPTHSANEIEQTQSKIQNLKSKIQSGQPIP